jgi:hypothetical protein
MEEEEEEEKTCSDTVGFGRWYNQGLRQGIMEAQEKWTEVGYWDGRNSGRVSRICNMYTSALIVVEYLEARGLLGKDGKEFSVVKSPCSSQKIKETRKELENLLQKYTSTLFDLGSQYTEMAQQMTPFVVKEEDCCDSFSTWKKGWISLVEQQEKSTLEQAKKVIQDLENSLEEPIKSCWEAWKERCGNLSFDA